MSITPRIPIRAAIALALDLKLPLFLALLALPSAGCIVDASQRAPAAGTLVVDWSIGGIKFPAKCSQSGSAAIEIAVNGPSGGIFTQDCGAFATSIGLASGNYSASARLIDIVESARTTDVSLGSFTIFGNDTLSVPIDFPASSFY